MLAGYTSCPLATLHLSTTHVELAPWFKSLQQFLSTINHSLHIPKLFCPRQLQEYDRAIMSLPQGGFSDLNLVRINQCRLFLQVHMLSDGTGLSTTVWQGHRPKNSSFKLLWPRQPRPSSASWRLWRKFLTPLLLLNSYTGYSSHLPLLRPLGRWSANFQDDRQWYWFYSPNLKSLI